MNKQTYNYTSNKNKKTYKNTTKMNQPNTKKTPIKSNITKNNNMTDKYGNYNNNNIYGSSVYSKNKKDLNKMMREYQMFVKQYLGETTPISCMTEERMNIILEDDNNKKKIIDEEKNNIEFQKILKNNKDLEFGDEDIFIQLPLEEEFFYCEFNKLGNNKNNKNDYIRREKLLFKNDENENEEKEPKKEESPKK